MLLARFVSPQLVTRTSAHSKCHTRPRPSLCSHPKAVSLLPQLLASLPLPKQSHVASPQRVHAVLKQPFATIPVRTPLLRPATSLFATSTAVGARSSPSAARASAGAHKQQHAVDNDDNDDDDENDDDDDGVEPSQPQNAARGAPLPRSSLAGFRTLGLVAPLVDELASLDPNITAPMRIQRLVVPRLLERRDVVFTEATGGGKTLAFLLPLLQNVKQDEQAAGAGAESDAVVVRPLRCPRAIVLEPSRQLAEQVLRIAKKLSHAVKLRVRSAIGSTDRDEEQRQLTSAPVDILIATPGRVNEYVKERVLSLDDVKYVVVDEADTLFDAGFGGEVLQLLQPLLARSTAGDADNKRRVNFAVLGATLSQPVKDVLTKHFPHAEVVSSHDAYRIPPSLTQRFLRVPGNSKLKELMRVLQERKPPRSRTIVFCNTVASCRAIEHALSEQKMDSVCYHGDMPEVARQRSYDAWISGERTIMVCTDAAARGLDPPGVAHVVLFDFPRTAADYLHRVGRTARAGAKGTATSLVAKRDRVLADAIEKATSAKRSLEALTSVRQRVVSELVPPPRADSEKAQPQQQRRRERPGRDAASEKPSSSTTTESERALQRARAKLERLTTTRVVRPRASADASSGDAAAKPKPAKDDKTPLVRSTIVAEGLQRRAAYQQRQITKSKLRGSRVAASPPLGKPGSRKASKDTATRLSKEFARERARRGPKAALERALNTTKAGSKEKPLTRQSARLVRNAVMRSGKGVQKATRRKRPRKPAIDR